MVPRFQAQIEAGGPVTVTHPDFVRCFATLEQGLAREECSAIYRALRDAVPDFKGEAA
jgi:hypothetical protein